MENTGNLITLDKGDVENFKRQKSAIDKLNNKMIILRQRQIYSSLSESTKLRIEMFQKIRTWINMLEKRIFDPKTVEEMDLNKVIALMKFTSNTALKLLAQMNDMETIFKTYVEMNNKSEDAGRMLEDKDTTDISKLKGDLYKILMETHISKEAETVEVSKIIPEVKKEEIVIDNPVPPKDDFSETKNEFPELDPK